MNNLRGLVHDALKVCSTALLFIGCKLFQDKKDKYHKHRDPLTLDQQVARGRGDGYYRRDGYHNEGSQISELIFLRY
jgi:hypothetical protein